MTIANNAGLHYLGNPRLRRADVVVPMTQEQMVEWAKCAQDPIYFIKKYVKIVNVDRGFIHFDLWPFQENIIRQAVDNRFVICKLPRQCGKDLDVDTPIATPSGFRRMGDLRVGDQVVDERGLPTNVVSVSDDIIGPGYRVVFDDGSDVVCGKDHQWTVIDRHYGEMTDTVENIYRRQWKQMSATGEDDYMLHIPNSEPVQYDAKDQSVDPYVVGAWLGKSIGDEEQSPVARIPDEYQYGSVDQRIALLRGLVDASGHVAKSGRISLHFKRDEHRALIEDVYVLLCSLGLKVARRAFVRSNSERLSFFVGRDRFDVCLLAHKLVNQKTTLYNFRRAYSRTIVNIIPIERVHGRCIQVDSPRSLYLCTKSHIPTHNTTTVMALMLWSTLFTEQYGIAVLAHKQSQAHEILSRYKEAYEALPMWLQQGVKEWNKGSIELENGSSVLASATSSSAVRGGSYSLVYLDELAFVPRSLQEEFFASVYPTISSGVTSKILITSTPNGLDMFHSIWAKATRGRNNYVPIEINWNDVPGRNEKWKEQVIADTSEAQFRVEFECRFEGSSNSLIPGHVIEKLIAEDPIDRSAEIKVFEPAVASSMYGFFVDVGQGVSGDFSVIQIMDITRMPFRQVGIYRDNKISPMLLPEVIYRLAQKYNNPIVVVERNDQGARVADSLFYDYELENVMQTTTNGRTGQVLAIGEASGRFGVQMTKAVKKIGCSHFKTLMENRQIIVRDEDTIREISTFVKRGDSYAAEELLHDDTVMPLVLLSWCSNQSLFKEITSTDARSFLLKAQSERLEESMLPIGLNTDDIDDGAELFCQPQPDMYSIGSWSPFDW